MTSEQIHSPEWHACEQIIHEHFDDEPTFATLISRGEINPNSTERMANGKLAYRLLWKPNPNMGVAWIIFGKANTGKNIAVVFRILCEDPLRIRPITAYKI